MTERLDIRIQVDGVPPTQVAVTSAPIGAGWIVLPFGELWNWPHCDRYATPEAAAHAMVLRSEHNVQRLLRGEGRITITLAQADEIIRQVREGAGWATPTVEVPECVKRPVRQMDMFARTA